MTELARSLAGARRKAKLTSKALAQRTGVPHGYIRSLESDGIKKPNPVRLNRLADELGLDASRLLALTDQLGAVVEFPPRHADDRLVEAVRLAVREELAVLAPTPPRPMAVAEEVADYLTPSLPSPWSVLIRLGRVAQGMTEGELGNYAGANTRTVRRWEAGEGEPSFRQRERLIALFAGLAQAPATAQRRRRTA